MNIGILQTKFPGTRLNKELQSEWIDKDWGDMYYIESENNNLYFCIFFEGKLNPVYITFNFNNGKYPFRPPSVFIGNNKYDYRSLLYSSFDFSDKIFGDKCLCCESITCRDNWRPAYHIKHLMDEIKHNLNLKIRLVDIFYCTKIINKYFGYYLPIAEFL
jgi:hypothetical protein